METTRGNREEYPKEIARTRSERNNKTGERRLEQRREERDDTSCKETKTYNQENNTAE